MESGYMLQMILYHLMLCQVTESININIKSPNHKSYIRLTDYGVDIRNTTNIMFQVTACSDAHLGLAQQDSFDLNMIEIAIGGWGNTKSVLRTKPQGEPVQNVKGSHLDCKFAKDYWVDWSNISIVFGQGTIVGVGVMFNFSPVSHPINYLGIYTAYGANGSWTFVIPPFQTSTPVFITSSTNTLQTSTVVSSSYGTSSFDSLPSSIRLTTENTPSATTLILYSFETFPFSTISFSYTPSDNYASSDSVVETQANTSSSNGDNTASYILNTDNYASSDSVVETQADTSSYTFISLGYTTTTVMSYTSSKNVIFESLETSQHDLLSTVLYPSSENPMVTPADLSSTQTARTLARVVMSSTDPVNAKPVFTDVVSQRSCTCYCHLPINQTEKDIELNILQLKKTLSVNRRNLSSTKRRLISVRDSRPVSVALGFSVGSFVMFAFIFAIIIPDAISFIHYIKTKYFSKRQLV